MNGRGVVVVVAYYVPPAVGIAVNRMTGFLRHLSEFGWDPLLIAPQSPHYHLGSAEEAERVLEGVDVVRVANPEVSRLFRRMTGHHDAPASEGSVRELHAATPGAWGSRLRDLVRHWVYVPDARHLWIPAAGSTAVQALSSVRGRRVVLFSSAEPFSCHLAGRRAAMETGVPWVAEYRDPWSVAPPQFGRRPRLRQMIDTRLDAGVVSRADHIVVTSDRTCELFLDGFPSLRRDRISVVRNGWEDGEEVGPPAGTDPARPLSLVYGGTLLDPSWAHPLLDGVEAVLADEPDSVRVEVFGAREPWQEALASRRQTSASYLHLHGLVPGAELPSHLRGASALVALQPDALLYVPGKVYDYIGARRPVLTDLPRGSEAEGLIAAFGDLRSFAGSGADGVVNEVRRLLAEHRAGKLQGASVPEDLVLELSRRSQTRRLAEVFDRLARS